MPWRKRNPGCPCCDEVECSCLIDSFADAISVTDEEETNTIISDYLSDYFQDNGIGTGDQALIRAHFQVD
jgi:hypothetical protein